MGRMLGWRGNGVSPHKERVSTESPRSPPWLFPLPVSELAEKSMVLSIPVLVLLSIFLILHETEPTYLCRLVTGSRDWREKGSWW